MRILLCRTRRTAGTTLDELMIGLVLSSLLLAMTGSLWVYGMRDLVATAHYTGRDVKSHNALHVRSGDLRPATPAIGFQNSSNTKGVRVTYAAVGRTMTCTSKVAPQTPACQRTGQPD
jgi:Tfp pilus assembly protein PilW